MTTAIRAPVRVNPLFKHPDECRMSLDGTWGFSLDPDDTGLRDQWFRKPDLIRDPVRVPGCWQGQGFGHDGKDRLWDFQLEARVFKATYKGTGWYRRSFEVPAGWQHKRLWLFFGGVHPSADVWLNGARLGGSDLPFVPFGFDITSVARPGKTNDLVVRVHEHHREFGMAFNWQGNWSGLYRGVDVVATGASWMEDLTLHPDADSSTLRGFVNVGSTATLRGLKVRVNVSRTGGGQTLETVFSPASAETSFAVKIPHPALWSPDRPSLYRVDVQLLDGRRVLDAMSERTGFVKLTTSGKHILINGEPFYMRGSGDFISSPETGCPDTDRARWRRKLRTLREYGYNYVRCQSYVYPPEYFDAADEVGLLVQSEMGMLGAWGGSTPWHVYQWPKPTADNRPVLRRQWNAIVRRDVNHPSANMYCMSNEYGANTDFHKTAWRCCNETKTIKPTAFVIWTDGGHNDKLPEDFVNAEAGQDSSCTKPLIQHEFRWWSSFPDVRIRHKYNGAIRPYAANMAEENAKRHGQGHLLKDAAAASQQLQLLEAKAKMEACRRDNPRLAGICHFDAMDANPSPQGIVDEFYERKLADSATWCRTNGDAVILCGLNHDNRIFGSGETLRCRLSVSDFSHPPFRTPRLAWRLVLGGKAVDSGSATWDHRPFCTCVAGEVVASMPQLKMPARLRLEARITEGGRSVSNSWNVWCFPEAPGLPSGTFRHGKTHDTWLAKLSSCPVADAGILKKTGRPGVLLAERIDAAVVAFMKRGGRVILSAGEGLVRPHILNFGYVKYFFTPPANYAPYEDGQNAVLVSKHRMLGDFPHESYADLQWFRMIDPAPPIDIGPLGLNDADPVIRVIQRYQTMHPLAYLLERRVGNGGLVVTSLNLDPALREARWLLARLIAFAGGRSFKSSPALSAASLKALVEHCRIDDR